MGNHNVSEALQQYKSVGVASAVEDASPHRLVQMLLQGAIARVIAAEGYLSRGETARKGESVSVAIGIIGGLQGSLDMEGGGEIAVNLSALYDYMARRLMEGNRDNDREPIEEVLHLLREIKEAWDGIPDSIASGEVAALRQPRESQEAGT